MEVQGKSQGLGAWSSITTRRQRVGNFSGEPAEQNLPQSIAGSMKLKTMRWGRRGRRCKAILSWSGRGNQASKGHCFQLKIHHLPLDYKGVLFAIQVCLEDILHKSIITTWCLDLCNGCKLWLVPAKISSSTREGEWHRPSFCFMSNSFISELLGLLAKRWDHLQQRMCIPHSFVLTSNVCHLVVFMPSASLLTYISELYISNASFRISMLLAWRCFS